MFRISITKFAKRSVSVAMAGMIFAGVIFGQEQQLTLDQAIAESMKSIAGKLPAGTKVAVLNIESGSKNLSEYVADESVIYIINNTKLSIVNKNTGDFNVADENAAAEIGKKIGASSVIIGSISKIGENYRFRVSAINTSNSQVQAAQSLSVAEDAVLRDLLGIKQNAAAVVENDLPKQNAKEQLGDKFLGDEFVKRLKEAEDGLAKLEARQHKRWRPSFLLFSLKYQQLFDTYKPSMRSDNLRGKDKQQIDNFLDEKLGEVVPIYPFHLEFGKKFINEQVLITGIVDVADYDNFIVGGGVSVGKVFSGGEVFRFIPALNLGFWYSETSYKEHSYLPLDLNWDKLNFLFGGPELRIMLGYKHIFADFGIKCMMGYSKDSFIIEVGSDSKYNSDYYTHFNAMFGWNIGLTAMF